MNEGVCQKLLRHKYLHANSLAEVSVKPLDAPFLEGPNKS
jgi:hypothetical protein